MTFNARIVQARLTAMGLNPGPIDGLWGPKTAAALNDGLGKSHSHLKDAKGLFHPSGLHTIIGHWTAGATGLIELELRAYHRLVDARGHVFAGHHAPEANINTSDGQYAPHTAAMNTGAISVSMDAMANAQERPFYPGTNPITKEQLAGFVEEIATLADTYDIPISRWTVLSHAEVQPTLGVKQRNKWDICWIPGMVAPGDAVEVGDVIRDMVRAA